MEKKLIEFVRDNPLFYDKTHTLYRNQIAREEKWMEFSEDINVPVDALKKRWKSLRDRYFRINKSNAPEKKSYKYYRNLRFLSGHERNISKSKGSGVTYDDDAVDDILSKSEDSFLLDEASYSTLYENETVSIAPAKTPAKNPDRKRKNDDLVEEENASKESIKMATPQNTTPFRAFLESIALTVENADFSIIELIHLQMNILKLVQTEMQNRNDD